MNSYTKKLIKCTNILLIFCLCTQFMYKLCNHYQTISANQELTTVRIRNIEQNQIGIPKKYYENRIFAQRGIYTVLLNYVSPNLIELAKVPYMDSITLATHTTSGYLQNLVDLIEFWNGPISIAIYAPGTDFQLVMDQISFIRECIRNNEKIKSLVTFHIFFESKYAPTELGISLLDFKLPKVDCLNFPNLNRTFKVDKKLMYPINVARNIAKENSNTYFVLVSDIELYPNPPNLISKFINMIKSKFPEEYERKHHSKQVFVLPPFEVLPQVRVPNIPRTRLHLQKFLDQNQANFFHRYACSICHRIPKQDEWIKNPKYMNKSKDLEDDDLSIFVSSPYITRAAWEPVYISTHFEPYFDERIRREEALNKVIQVAALCHQNYTFHILENAFLVHKPGVRHTRTFKSFKSKEHGKNVSKEQILPLQKILYGSNDDKCWT